MKVGERYLYSRPEFRHEFIITGLDNGGVQFKYRQLGGKWWDYSDPGQSWFHEALLNGKIKIDETYNVKNTMQKYE